MKKLITDYKYWIIGVVLVILFFSAKSCNDKQVDQLHGENKIKKELVKKLEKTVDSINKRRLVEKDYILAENIKKEAKLKDLKDRELASLDKIKTLQREASKTKAQLRDLDLVGVANELNTTYGGKNAVAEGSSIRASGYLPYQLLETVVDANTCQDVVKEKDTQLFIKDSVIVIKDQQIKNSSVLLVSAEKTIKGFKELNELQTSVTKGLEKENKKLRTKNFFTKVLVPVSLGVGIFLGTQIGK